MFRRVPAAFLAIALLCPAEFAAAEDSATLVRVFLKDGTALVSYGEPARVGDRVVFSMPTAVTPDPPLHLVTLALDRVDWERTTRYVATARSVRYIESQAEIDYAALSNDIARTLNEVAMTPDAASRLAIVERARRTLADWPQTHYNYRAAEVRQMLGLLDEAIADLRAAAGAQRFNLAFTAYVDPPGIVEPMMPPPTPQEAVEAVLLAARTVDNASERASLLASAVLAIDAGRDVLPAGWAAARRVEVEAAIQADRRTDRGYQTLTTQTMTLAAARARLADVHGLERLLRSIAERDAALGAKRPEAVAALIAAVDEKLDAARRLQLARERWALREPALHEYRAAIAAPMDLFATLKPALENIKALAGSTPLALSTIQRAAARTLSLAAAIAPPEELAAAHALLVSAVQLAAHAAQIRREAVLAGDMARAWDASSAAAGALMLGARARTDMQSQFKPPQLR